ncbi:hypothetical protein Bbelb_072430 [Branchiostoma belcheri]|nr:hypothetical protein Bbelb_072430 [Branchiostoma belcheri]
MYYQWAPDFAASPARRKRDSHSRLCGACPGPVSYPTVCSIPPPRDVWLLPALSDVACIINGKKMGPLRCTAQCIINGRRTSRPPLLEGRGIATPACVGHVLGRSATRRYAAFPRPGTFGF